MSHLFESGFTVGEKSWHQLENNLKTPPRTLQEFLRESGLGWTVSLQPIFRAAHPDPIADYKAIVRDDNDRCLGIVGSRYRPLQNEELFRFFEPLIESGLIDFESAMALEDGKKVFALGKWNGLDAEVSPGDKIKPYLLIVDSKDLSTKTIVKDTDIRTICHNTLMAALSEGENIYLKHTKGAKDKLASIRQIFERRKLDFDVQVAIYRRMHQTPMRDAEFQEYLTEVFPPPMERVKKVLRPTEIKLDDIIDATEKKSGIEEFNFSLLPRSDKERYEIMRELLPRQYEKLDELWQSAPGAEPGTLWGGFNAVTNYIDHHRSRDSETALESTMVGIGSQIRDTAYQRAIARFRN